MRYLVLIALVALSSCALLSNNYAYAFRKGPVTKHVLVFDSPKVHARLSVEATSPRTNPHERFLDAMTGDPSAAVVGGIYCRLLERSDIKCARLDTEDVFAKIRVTNGPQRGSIGWVCLYTDIARTVATP